MQNNVVNALSVISDKIERQIITPVILKNVVNGVSCSTMAIWDTGATGSVVAEDKAAELQLIPTGTKRVSGISGERESNEYFLNVTLNNNQISLNINVTDCSRLSPDGSIGMLIGMDIISKGDLYITNFEGKTIMSFRIPSLLGRDFVAELSDLDRWRKIHDNIVKHGNSKCPCGSGKQWNKCHGRSIAEQYR